MDKRKEDVSVLKLVPLFLSISLHTLIRAFKSPFRGNRGAPTIRQDIAYAFLRQLLTRLSTAETQALSETTEQVYEKEAKRLEWKHHTIDLGNGAKGHWLGPDNAKYVLLFFHGGGFIGHATPGHLKYQFALQSAVQKLGHDFAIFSLSYTLAPHQLYPFQLSQAVLALKYLLETKKRDPRTIFIGGDSAGGNLTSQLLLHLAKPHPSVPAVKLASRLKGAVLISPWVSFATDSRSFTDNAESDYLTVEALNNASSTFIGPRGAHDEYSEPVRASPDRWGAVAAHVDEVIIWGGGGEIMIDGIRAFANNVASGFAASQRDASIDSAAIGRMKMNGARTRMSVGLERVFYVETPRASHEEQIMDHTLGIKSTNGTATVIEDWVCARL